MTFPSLPTDNLYKFIALAGIVVVILSIYSVETKILEVHDHIVDTEEDQHISLVKLESLQNKMKLLEKIVDNSIAEQNG